MAPQPIRRPKETWTSYLVLTVKYGGLKATQYFSKFTNDSYVQLLSDLTFLGFPHPKRAHIVFKSHGTLEFFWPIEPNDQSPFVRNLRQRVTLPQEGDFKDSQLDRRAELSIVSFNIREDRNYDPGPPYQPPPSSYPYKFSPKPQSSQATIPNYSERFHPYPRPTNSAATHGSPSSWDQGHQVSSSRQPIPSTTNQQAAEMFLDKMKISLEHPVKTEPKEPGIPPISTLPIPRYPRSSPKNPPVRAHAQPGMVSTLTTPRPTTGPRVPTPATVPQPAKIGVSGTPQTQSIPSTTAAYRGNPPLPPKPTSTPTAPILSLPSPAKPTPKPTAHILSLPSPVKLTPKSTAPIVPPPSTAQVPAGNRTAQSAPSVQGGEIPSSQLSQGHKPTSNFTVPTAPPPSPAGTPAGTHAPVVTSMSPPNDPHAVQLLNKELTNLRSNITSAITRQNEIIDTLSKLTTAKLPPKVSLSSVHQHQDNIAMKARLIELEGELQARDEKNSKIVQELEVERTRRLEMEDVMKDVERECKAPFIVPALLEAFVKISHATSAAINYEGDPSVAKVS